MFNLEEQGGEAKAVGWISMSDMFMLCSIVMLAVAVCFAVTLKKTDTSLATVEGNFAAYRNTNNLTIDELKSKVTLLASEAGGYRTQATDLEQQLKNLKSQLATSEQQLSQSKNESAKFRAQGEGLASELTIQISKLNSVQSEFDKYKNINTLSMEELKSALARLMKEASDSKALIASLRSQVDDSQKQVAALTSDRSKLGSESAQLAADLQIQKTNFELALRTANADMANLKAGLSKADIALSKAGSEKEKLMADLDAQKAAYVILQREENALRLELDLADANKKKYEAKLAGLTGTISGLTDEIGELKPQLAKLDSDLTGAKLRIIDLEKAVFEKINRAKLVITLTALDVPKDYTLELFVTDPLANECGPFSSEIFNDGDEIGVLQQSIDFKSGKEGSQKAVFYSSRPIYARNEPGRTYTVKAMIRHNGNSQNAQLPHPVTVNCAIDLPNIAGPNGHQVATLEITSPGYINKVRRSGQLTASSPYKNMWPWEPVYHFDRTVCDFRIDGTSIVSFRTFDKIYSETPITIQAPISTGREQQELKIDSIRNRSGN